jgi:hypothetical protein
VARYRKLMVQGETGWYLMSPRNPWEALKLAWYLWRYPDRVGALVGVSQEFMLAKCKPESPNTNSGTNHVA